MDKYLTFWRRFWALIIDSILLWIVNFTLSLGSMFISEEWLRLAIVGALVSLIYPLYFILLHTFYGQTLGKKAAGVKVLDDSEVPINFGQAVIRSLPQLIPALFVVTLLTRNESALDETNTIVSVIISSGSALFYLADIIVCLVNHKQRALHDFIARTVVVRTDI